MQCSNIFGDVQCTREASWNSNLCSICDHEWNKHKDKLDDLNFRSAKQFIPKSMKLTPAERTSIMNLGNKPKIKLPKPTKPIVAPETPSQPPRGHLHDIMTPNEVAEYLSISWITLKRWTKAGRLNCIRINERGDRRYLRSEIERILGGTK